MRKFQIKDIADEISIRIDDPKTSGYDKFIGLEHYDSGKVLITRAGITSNLDSSVKEFKKGDVLIARRNVYLKRAGLVDFDGVTSGDSIVIRAKEKSIERLLPFVFNTDKFWDFATQFADGSMSKRLSPKKLIEYEVELPDTVEERNNLADILWKMYETMSSYEEMLVESDNVVKSQFIEMFKDDLCGDKICLGDITKLITKGTTPTTLGFNFEDDGINFIKIESISDNYQFIRSKILHISSECDNRLKRSKLEENDILFSIAGAIGRTAIVTKDILPANTNQALSIIRLKDNSPLNVDFLNEMLHSELIRKQIFNKANGSTQVNLSLTDVENFKIIVPNIQKQNKFSSFVKQIDKSKFCSNILKNMIQFMSRKGELTHVNI